MYIIIGNSKKKFNTRLISFALYIAIDFTLPTHPPGFIDLELKILQTEWTSKERITSSIQNWIAFQTTGVTGSPSPVASWSTTTKKPSWFSRVKVLRYRCEQTRQLKHISQVAPGYWKPMEKMIELRMDQRGASNCLLYGAFFTPIIPPFLCLTFGDILTPLGSVKRATARVLKQEIGKA